MRRLLLTPLRPLSRFARLNPTPTPHSLPPIVQLLKALDVQTTALPHNTHPQQDNIHSLLAQAIHIQAHDQVAYHLELNLLLKIAKLLVQSKAVSQAKAHLGAMVRVFLGRHHGKLRVSKLNYLLTYLKKLDMHQEMALFFPELERLLEEEVWPLEALGMVFNVVSVLGRTHPCLLHPHHSHLVTLLDCALNKDYLNTTIDQKFIQVLFEAYMVNYVQLEQSVFFIQLVNKVKQQLSCLSDKTMTFLTNDLGSCQDRLFCLDMLTTMEPEWLHRLPGLDSKQFCLVLKAYNKNKAISPALQASFQLYLQHNHQHIKIYDYVQIFIQYSKGDMVTKEFIHQVEDKVMLVFGADQKVSASNASIYQELVYCVSHSAPVVRLQSSSYDLMAQFLVTHLPCFSYLQVASIVPCCGFLKQNPSTSQAYNQLLIQVQSLMPTWQALLCLKSFSSLYLTFTYQHEQPAKFPPPARRFFEEGWHQMDTCFDQVFSQNQKIGVFVINLRLAVSFQKNQRRREVSGGEVREYERVGRVVGRLVERQGLLEGVDGEELKQIQASLQEILKGDPKGGSLLEGLDF